MRHWLTTLARTLQQGFGSANMSLAGAGCALYAMLAVFPLPTLLVAVYGTARDPAALEPALATLGALLPEEAYALIARHLAELAAAPRPRLGTETAITLGRIAAFSASSGIRALLSALSILRGAPETRSLVAFYATVLAMTLLGLLALAAAVAALVVLLPVLPLLGVPPELVALLRRSTLVPAALLICPAVAELYRYGPAGPRAPWRRVLPGAVFANPVWIAASVLFSLYVSAWADHGRVYGALEAAMALLMWFCVSAHLLFLGMARNVERERA
jgi:membrane protein